MLVTPSANGVSRPQLAYGDAPFQRVAGDGFQPLRKAVSAPSPGLLERRFSSSFPSKPLAELERKKTFWEVKNPWRGLNRTASFVSEAYVKFKQQKSVAEDARQPREERMVAVVDPFSTGALLAAAVEQRGFHVIRILSEYNSPVADLVQESISCSFDATIQHNNLAADQQKALQDTIAELKALPWALEAILPGAETGVSLADQLTFALELRGNGEEHSRARRNKYLMGEAVRAAGVRAVKQLYATEWEQVAEFLQGWPEPFLAVVKPLESAGSDDVFKCGSAEEVETAFRSIHGKKNGLGQLNDGALVQEFLAGREFVIDGVSRDGVYKVMAIWEYDKRSVNGANFVYFGMRPRCEDGPEMTALIDYAASVVDALTIRNGPSHMEVMVMDDGPCLVEVGARCHGGEGTWCPIAKACYGYTQVDGTVASFFSPEAFDSYPPRPTELRAHGREVFFVVQESGVIRTMPGVQVIKNSPSFHSLEMMVKPGDFIAKTIDCFTRPGAAQLLHTDAEVVAKDYEMLRALELPGGGLFDLSLVCEEDPRQKGIVVVVDPFSTGAQLAAEVVKRGFRLVMVLAERDSPVAELVVGDNEFGNAPTIQHDNAEENQDSALAATIQALRDMKEPVIAVVPGAETGVLLADRLAVELGTRNNGMKFSLHRRNKYLMGEQVRDCGIRAVKQLRATEWGAIAAFIRDWDPSPFKVIVKPIESAGSDDVFLCEDIEQVQEAFVTVNGKVNGLGQVNEGVLVQEYLDGTEYVIDHVSRDGLHKCVALWEYDKRPVNGAPFVYYGMRPRCADSDEVHGMIEYARQVLDALEIRNGPSHMEIKLTATGPCLVEVGSRCHGGEGTWLPIAERAYKYTMVDVTLDSYIDADAFERAPDRPLSIAQDGREVDLVSHYCGVLESMPGVDEIRSFESFFRCEMVVQPGASIMKTIDCFSRPGSVQLTHEDPSVVARDYERIRELEQEGLFILKEDAALPLPPRVA